jgi:hypothetical protein
MSFVYESVQEQKKMVRQLGGWIEKGVEFAKAKSFDPSILLAARLAPDQYPLLRQVQAVCDNAKFAGARLSGKEAPKHPDTEQTVEEIRVRIQSCLAFLDTLKPADFEGAEARLIDLHFMPGKVITGSDYLTEMALPNFYFHLTTAYAILRHNGVPLGKSDFIGSLNLLDK